MKTQYIFLGSCIIFLLSPFIMINNPGYGSIVQPNDSFGYIRINGDQNLLEFANKYNFPGTGSKDDPIVFSKISIDPIFNVSVDYSIFFLISINNTSLHLIIKDSKFTGLKSYDMDTDLERVSIAISITNSANISLFNNTISNSFYYGLDIYNSSNIKIANNIIKNPAILETKTDISIFVGSGINILDSYLIEVINNSIADFLSSVSFNNVNDTLVDLNEFTGFSSFDFDIPINGFNFTFANNKLFNQGLFYEPYLNFNEMIIKNNEVNGKPLLVVINETQKNLQNFGQVIIINSSSINLFDFSITNVRSGITAFQVQDITIKNGIVESTYTGFDLRSSKSISISDISFVETQNAISLSNINLSTIRSSNFFDSQILLKEGFNNSISGNDFKNGLRGVVLGYNANSYSGFVKFNNITSNTFFNVTNPIVVNDFSRSCKTDNCFEGNQIYNNYQILMNDKTHVFNNTEYLIASSTTANFPYVVPAIFLMIILGIKRRKKSYANTSHLDK